MKSIRNVWLAVTACVLLLPAQAQQVPAAAAAPRFVMSAYKDLFIAADARTHVMASAAPYDGPASPVLAYPQRLPGRAKALSWAFATGECGSENWGGQAPQAIADANVQAFAAAGVDYIISTGGAIGVFTCASDEGMEKFIARYASPRLIGIDFDIEGEQGAEVISALVERVRVAQQRRPQLRFSFTIATRAASDGSLGSLNAHGELILRTLRAAKLDGYVINLMVMDYGPAEAANCVVRDGVCDMAKSALQAAHNVHEKYGVPYEQMELTPMLGVNDVVANVFTPDDAREVARIVRTYKMAGLHYWSLDRDQPCPASRGVKPDCSTLPAPAIGAFARAFEQGMAEPAPAHQGRRAAPEITAGRDSSRTPAASPQTTP